MKSYLSDKEQIFADLQAELYSMYPKNEIVLAVVRLLHEVKAMAVEVARLNEPTFTGFCKIRTSLT